MSFLVKNAHDVYSGPPTLNAKEISRFMSFEPSSGKADASVTLDINTMRLVGCVSVCV